MAADQDDDDAAKCGGVRWRAAIDGRCVEMEIWRLEMRNEEMKMKMKMKTNNKRKCVSIDC